MDKPKTAVDDAALELRCAFHDTYDGPGSDDAAWRNVARVATKLRLDSVQSVNWETINALAAERDALSTQVISLVRAHDTLTRERDEAVALLRRAARVGLYAGDNTGKIVRFDTFETDLESFLSRIEGAR